MTELKNKIKKILKDNNINPGVVLDLGCKNMPYSDLFPESKIIGYDINQNIKLHFKLIKNKNLSFNFQNFNIKQELPKAGLVIASLVLHFLDEKARDKLFQEIAKSEYFLVVHLDEDNKVDIPHSNFKLISQDKFETEKETHNNSPEHTHEMIIELYGVERE